MSTLLSHRQIPQFLTSVYQEGFLDRTSSTLAALDTRTNILWVNESWYRFARSSGVEFSLSRYPSYLDGISGPLRADYERVLATVLATGEVFEQDYECSTPDAICHFRMRVLPFLPGGLLVEHSEVEMRAAPPGEAAIEELYFDDHRQILQCSNCRRVRRPVADVEKWVWVREWVARSHPRTSHGLCTACLGYYWRRPRRR